MRDFLADVEQLARSTTGGRWPRLGQVEGSDASGMVQLAIDDDGAFASLYLDPAWWRTLGVSGLPAALREAQRVARDKLTVARLTFRRLIGPPPEATTPVGEDGFEFRHGLSRTSDVEELLRSWTAMTAESYQRMYEFDRRRDGEPTVVAGPEGLVRLTLSGGMITEVELAEWRLSEDSTDRLTADIRAALQEQRRGHHA
jgi:hypothetical protein